MPAARAVAQPVTPQRQPLRELLAVGSQISGLQTGKFQQTALRYFFPQHWESCSTPTWPEAQGPAQGWATRSPAGTGAGPSRTQALHLPLSLKARREGASVARNQSILKAAGSGWWGWQRRGCHRYCCCISNTCQTLSLPRRASGGTCGTLNACGGTHCFLTGIRSPGVSPGALRTGSGADGCGNFLFNS